jgi:hypothetical protein
MTTELPYLAQGPLADAFAEHTKDFASCMTVARSPRGLAHAGALEIRETCC